MGKPSARVEAEANRVPSATKKIVQAIGACFCEPREHPLGARCHPVAGKRRWEMIYWMDLMVRLIHIPLLQLSLLTSAPCRAPRSPSSKTSST